MLTSKPPRINCFLIVLLGTSLFAQAARAETLIWKDEAGAIHLTDNMDLVPEASRDDLVESGDSLTELWDGDVRRKLPLPDDAQMNFEVLRTPFFEVFWEEGIEAKQGVISGTQALMRGFASSLDVSADAVHELLGLRSTKRVEVLIYQRSSYQQRYQQKFPFATAGFFDGRIHIAADALHSSRVLRLVRHEYAHALFGQAVGNDRPFWLNEGLAESAARAKGGLTEAERLQLVGRIEEGKWIALADLEPGFSHFDSVEVRWAYLESVAAASWIQTQLTSSGRGRLLSRLGETKDLDSVFQEFFKLDRAELDDKVRASLQAIQPAL
jgi:hypothetical protein